MTSPVLVMPTARLAWTAVPSLVAIGLAACGNLADANPPEWKAVMRKSGPLVERGVPPCPKRVSATPALLAASGRSPSGVFVAPARHSDHIALTAPSL